MRLLTFKIILESQTKNNPQLPKLLQKIKKNYELKSFGVESLPLFKLLKIFDSMARKLRFMIGREVGCSLQMCKCL